MRREEEEEVPIELQKHTCVACRKVKDCEVIFMPEGNLYVCDNPECQKVLERILENLDRYHYR